MDEFFTILTPLAQCLVDNFNYILIVIMLFSMKSTRVFGFSLALAFMLWGFQTWIVVVMCILAILLESSINLYDKHKSSNKE